AAAAFILQDNIQNQFPLLSDPHSFFAKQFQDLFFLLLSSIHSFILHPEHPPLHPAQDFPDFLSFQILRTAAAAIASITIPTIKVPIMLSPFLSDSLSVFRPAYTDAPAAR